MSTISAATDTADTRQPAKIDLGVELNNIQTDIGVKFDTVLCLCNYLSRRPEHCMHRTSLTDYFDRDLSGHANLLIVPSRDAFKIMRHYLTCKRRAPDTTSACIVVPKHYGRRYGFAKNMRLLRSYKSNVFCPVLCADSECRSDGMTGLVDVWHDPPTKIEVSTAFCSPRSLRTAMTGTLNKLVARVFLDTGATHNFVSRAFVDSHNLESTVATASVHCAGNPEVISVSGMINARVTLKGIKSDMTLFIIDLPSGLDVCIGDAWLEQHGARIFYDERCVYLRKGKKMHRLLFEQHENLPPPPPRPGSVSLLSAVQTAKIWKKRDCVRSFLVCVTQSEKSEDSNDCDPRTSEVLKDFENVFDPIPGLPDFRDVNHIIDTGNAEPVSRGMYRMSLKEKAEVERQVKELLDKGFIQPSNSPYGAPVLFVQKKDGGLRMCGDYRGLNAVTKKDKYPPPRIDDLIDKLHGAQWFTSLDLQQGYNQIRIDPADVPKTAFRTHQGLFEFKVLSFGLTERVMNNIFEGLPFVLVYLDDILIFRKTEHEHREHIRQVMSILKAQKLYAKRSKCAFFQRSMKFLGHVISADGIAVDPDKIDVIKNWPQPQNASDVRSFLGLGNYFKQFVQGYSKLISPLIELTKPSRAFDWNPEANNAFLMLKLLLSSAPVLALEDLTAPLR